MMGAKILKYIAGGLVLIWAIFALWPVGPYEPYQPSDEYLEKAAAYREANITPMPENWRWQYFTAKDGKKMRYGVATPQGQVRGTVIYVPGYTGALEMYADYHAEYLKRGFRVIGFDLRGQGGSARMLSNPEKPWVKKFSVYSDDVAEFVKFIRPQYSGKLLLMGESFGGHVSLRAVGDHNLPLDGLILGTPAMKIQTAPYAFETAQAIVELSRILGFGEKYAMQQGNWRPFTEDLEAPNYCGDNFSRIHIKDTLYAVRPELRVGGTTNQWTAEIMKSGKHISRPEYLAKIKLPILLVTGDEDAIVDAEVSKAACDSDLEDCSLLVLEDAGHCTNTENEKTRLKMFDRIDAFFEGLG